MLWFGIAVALHAALLLGLWLMPPLRLKWSPSADSWVQVFSLPKEQRDVPISNATNPQAPVHASAKRHQTQPAGESQ